MSTKKRTTPELWKALSNEIRRELLSYIGERRVVSFTEIQSRFQMKVGTLYHHIDTLGELITQDQSKRYLLTEKGKRAYVLIEDELDIAAPGIQAYGKFSFFHVFFLRPLFQFIERDAIRSLGFSVLIFIGLTLATYFLSVAPIFMFPSFITPPYFAPVFFILSTILTYILFEILTILFFRRRNNKLALLQAVVIAQIPLILLSVLVSFISDFEYTTSILQMEIWAIILFFFVQLIYAGFLMEAVIVIKELRLEKAGSISLLAILVLNGLAFVIMNMLEVAI
ncbi:MAG: helix-turn-helix transcriptional regulator [Candidatus Heimdallarchaeota archaeon]|nr:helix-turn-helix transcriptional regulator [Candidatus Heimdallarchaeota archaeon]MCK4768848.1 helix-turn-helix transcriptional regulator [Candidatus Heimdallarchaeota archaeon]